MTPLYPCQFPPLVPKNLLYIFCALTEGLCSIDVHCATAILAKWLISFVY